MARLMAYGDGNWISNFTFASTDSSTSNDTWYPYTVTIQSPPVDPTPPATLREKTAVEKLDDRINEVRALVAA